MLPFGPSSVLLIATSKRSPVPGSRRVQLQPPQTVSMRSLILLLAVFVPISGEKCAWDNCPTWTTDPNKLNLHFVPHSHEDLGWLKTADEYYTGYNPMSVNVAVQYIINTVIDQLERNPEYRFTYCETGFLTRWLEDHGQKDIDRLVALVNNGQLELVNGGWVQPDEAATHYIDLLDVYTLGLRQLNRTFASRCAVPRTGWQLDPFGHSREHANLLAMMGYESVYFAREHHLEHDLRKKNKQREFTWLTSNENPARQVMGAALYDMYWAPWWMNWDILAGQTPVVDQKSFSNYNVDQMVANVYKYAQEMRATQPHNHLLFMMGADFTFTDAHHNFVNMDRIIKYVKNSNYSSVMSIQYSTPSCYTQQVQRSNSLAAKKLTDFFPYADQEHNYWTGYFTSKPAMKGLVRTSSNFLQTVRQMASFSQIALDETDPSIQKLERAMSLSQHHDGITGTSKQFVTEDYQRRIIAGYEPAQSVLRQSLGALSQRAFGTTNAFPKLDFCHLLNETVCDFTNSNEKTFAVMVFNSFSQPVSQLVRLPVYSDLFELTHVNGSTVESAYLLPSFQTFSQINNSNAISPFVLNFVADLPANGFDTYFMTISSSKRQPQLIQKPQPKSNSIKNGILELTFNDNNLLSSVRDLRTARSFSLQQNFLFYEGHDDSDGHPSGAYLFRPQSETPTIVNQKPKLSLLYSEARQVFGDYVSQTIRLAPQKDYIEFEWTVGPLPKRTANGINYGKEFITRYTASGIVSNSTFFVDSNGRQLMQRIKNFSPDFTWETSEPVASNYYPVNSKALVRDAQSALVVLTDRAQAVASLTDGSLEFLIHRRDYYDDHKGVDEILSEPGRDGRGLVVRGIHRVFIGDPQAAVAFHRQEDLQLYHQPVVFFAETTDTQNFAANFATRYSGLVAQALPKNVHIVTMKPLGAGTILLRLEHTYAKSEDSVLSQPVTVQLDKLFADLKVTAVQEMTLAANDFLAGIESTTTITLNPQDIKTFQVSVATA